MPDFDPQVSPNDTAYSREFALQLTNIAHLFNDPRIDPLSRSPAEALGVSGVDHSLNLLHHPTDVVVRADQTVPDVQ